MTWLGPHGPSCRNQPGSGTATAQLYLDFVYQPIKDSAGTVSGIFVEGADVSSRAMED